MAATNRQCWSLSAWHELARLIESVVSGIID